MKQERASLRYARALLENAIENKSADKVLDDLNKIEQTLKSVRELHNLFMSPIIPETKKIQVFEEVYSDMINELTLKFLILLTKKNREDIILTIKNEYYKLYNLEYNRQPVIVYSAFELNEELTRTLIEKLEKMTSKKILPTFKVDKNLKGGIKIKIDDIIYDASLDNQLKQIKDKLVAN